MSSSLLVLAVVVAALCVPTVAAMTAWGLSGGDGEPETAALGVLAALVALGAVYNAVVAYRAFWGIPEWAWWLMWLSPLAGTVGILLARHDLGPEPSARELVTGLGLQLPLTVPAALLWWAGVAS